MASGLTSPRGEPFLPLPPPPLLYFRHQVSVLTDQVEAQGEKIRDLEVCLEGHQVKLNAAEEMLQQVRATGLRPWGSTGPQCSSPFLCRVKAPAFPSFLEVGLAAQCVVLIQQVKPAGTLSIAEQEGGGEGEGGAGRGGAGRP